MHTSVRGGLLRRLAIAIVLVFDFGLEHVVVIWQVILVEIVTCFNHIDSEFVVYKERLDKLC